MYTFAIIWMCYMSQKFAAAKEEIKKQNFIQKIFNTIKSKFKKVKTKIC
jgi:hypothetical protein